MKSLKHLFIKNSYTTDLEAIFALGELSELHLFFVYGPDYFSDPSIRELSHSSGQEARFTYLAKNLSRLANRIPFCESLRYDSVELNVQQGSEINFLKKFPDLNEIRVYEPVKNVERFLKLRQFRTDLNSTNEKWLNYYVPRHPDLVYQVRMSRHFKFKICTEPIRHMVFNAFEY